MKALSRYVSGGFTLLEALLAAVILAMAITAITMPFTAAAQNEQIDARQTLAVNLAEEMMEEILSQPVDDPDGQSAPGPEKDEKSLSQFDNIDDYDGLVETGGFGDAVEDQAESAGLSRVVTVSYVRVAGQDTDDEPAFIRVSVEVSHNGSGIVRLTRLVYCAPL